MSDDGHTGTRRSAEMGWTAMSAGGPGGCDLDDDGHRTREAVAYNAGKNA